MLPLDFDRPRSKLHSWLGEKRFGFPISTTNCCQSFLNFSVQILLGQTFPLALLVPALLLNQKQAPLPSMVKDRCRLRMLLIRVYPRNVSIFFFYLWLSSDTLDCTYWLQHLSSRFGNNILASGATAGFFVRAMQYQSPVQGIIGSWPIQNLCSYRCFWPFWEFRCARTTTESYYILPKMEQILITLNHAESRSVLSEICFRMPQSRSITLIHARIFGMFWPFIKLNTSIFMYSKVQPCILLLAMGKGVDASRYAHFLMSKRRPFQWHTLAMTCPELLWFD